MIVLLWLQTEASGNDCPESESSPYVTARVRRIPTLTLSRHVVTWFQCLTPPLYHRQYTFHKDLNLIVLLWLQTEAPGNDCPESESSPQVTARVRRISTLTLSRHVVTWLQFLTPALPFFLERNIIANGASVSSSTFIPSRQAMEDERVCLGLYYR
ncbi:hypothetical protein CHS0354_039240 [Potamilus streckersoni]|uniref:Uncharacterized protein n=1 Tax=Potamilus streckersoni TaxID=2493646 RepID=A0AAE0WB80_9BIVA|nr:hypothetical protein CHS0354_039240 [Potamilus streckersoni]